MGQTLDTLFVFLAALTAVARGAFAAAGLVAAADDFARSWREEYGIRRCGQVAAAMANLRDAGEYVAGISPGDGQRARVAAAALADAVAATYSGTGPQPDAYGFCRGEGDLAAELHDQRHPGQPRHWPNWVVRLVPSPEP